MRCAEMETVALDGDGGGDDAMDAGWELVDMDDAPADDGMELLCTATSDELCEVIRCHRFIRCVYTLPDGVLLKATRALRTHFPGKAAAVRAASDRWMPTLTNYVRTLSKSYKLAPEEVRVGGGGEEGKRNGWGKDASVCVCVPYAWHGTRLAHTRGRITPSTNGPHSPRTPHIHSLSLSLSLSLSPHTHIHTLLHAPPPPLHSHSCPILLTDSTTTSS